MTKELSIFIDESGDFGKYDPRSPYYIIGMVIHDQNDDISEPLAYMERGLKQTNYRRNCVHVGPLIRRETEYQHLSVVERVYILRKIINFVTKTEIRTKTFVVDKKHIQDEVELATKLAKQISVFIRQNYTYFLSFDEIKVYYDNGQVEVTKVMASVFTSLFDNAEMKKAFQKDYRLAQVADLVCTAELIRLKLEMHVLSKSERRVLGSDRDIQKNLLKPLKRKEFRDRT